MPIFNFILFFFFFFFGDLTEIMMHVILFFIFFLIFHVVPMHERQEPSCPLCLPSFEVPRFFLDLACDVDF